MNQQIDSVSYQDLVLDKYNFAVLVVTVMIAGMSQGLLLPLLAILLEQAGVSSALNGFNAAALYAGVFITSFFIEKPVVRFGYKPIIIFGLILITIGTLLFPAWQNLWFWFLLRFLVGMGDSALHYATQLWITSEAPADRRGRMISIYGFAYGSGFSLGPLGINLLYFGIWVPFLTVSIFYAISFFMVSYLPRRLPQNTSSGQNSGYAGYLKAWKWAWLPLLTPLLYGYMEASLNGNFPVYGLRTGLSEVWVSLLLSSFVVGSLILQLPLGILSDRIGRKKVLLAGSITGGLAFLLIPFAATNLILLLSLFMVAGAMVGSFFSLGLAYTADILPKSILPKANVMAAVLFSIGSIIGPNLGGVSIDYISPGSIFYLIGSALLLFFVSGWVFTPQRSKGIAKD